ncbi:hypothetical protein [Mesorhizobium sp. WSM3866]|uniref:hypothetical protein n=1 Tax=Mesorhizobium sp. WSM3866 TaxID=422271 RepID=UPI001596D2D4|nr:hypothetical protein [Mesorhizobium sp. WSM3866]
MRKIYGDAGSALQSLLFDGTLQCFEAAQFLIGHGDEKTHGNALLQRRLACSSLGVG